MTTHQAIAALQSIEGLTSTDKQVRRAAKRAFKIAARNLWDAWKAERHPEHATEILNAYNICFA